MNPRSFIPVPRLARHERALAPLGVTAAGLVLAVAGSVGGWASWHHAAELAARRGVELRALEEGIAAHTRGLRQDPAALESLRRMAAAAGESGLLVSCRVTLADGTVVADADAPGGGVGPAPAQLAGPAPLGFVEPAAGPTGPGAPGGAGSAARGAQAAQADGAGPLRRVGILGGGEATLELVRRADSGIGAVLPIAGGAGLAAGVGLGVVWLAYRGMRSRLRGLAAIREALTRAGANAPAAAFGVGEGWGRECEVWNGLVAELDRLREAARAMELGGKLAAGAPATGDLANACDALWQGLVLVDGELRIKYANGAAAVFLGSRRDEVLSGDLAALLPDEKVVAALRAAASGAARNRVVVESRRAAAGEGAARPAETGERRGAGAGGLSGAGVLRYSIRAVRREDGAAAMLMIEDVTQQRVADEARNQFVAHATHELRTPLTNIRLYVEELIDGAGDDAARRAECLNVVSQEARRLERVVGDMLSVSEIEAGSLTLHAGDVRLEPLFAELSADFRPQAEAKGVALSMDFPPKWPVLAGDRDKLAMAVHNLVGNAIKYTPAGGKVTVRVREELGLLMVAVEDTGIGIRPEECELVFDRFYRAKDKRIAGIVGSGLGLALAREVARLHGGDVVVRSQIDKGSTFTLSVPLGGAVPQRLAA